MSDEHHYTAEQMVVVYDERKDGRDRPKVYCTVYAGDDHSGQMAHCKRRHPRDRNVRVVSAQSVAEIMFPGGGMSD